MCYCVEQVPKVLENILRVRYTLDANLGMDILMGTHGHYWYSQLGAVHLTTELRLQPLYPSASGTMLYSQKF